MQPCVGCGGTGVDEAGYCVHCRMYRGHRDLAQQSDSYRTFGSGQYASPGSGSQTSGQTWYGGGADTGGQSRYGSGADTSGQGYYGGGSDTAGQSYYGGRAETGAHSPYGGADQGGNAPYGAGADQGGHAQYGAGTDAGGHAAAPYGGSHTGERPYQDRQHPSGSNLPVARPAGGPSGEYPKNRLLQAVVGAEEHGHDLEFRRELAPARRQRSSAGPIAAVLAAVAVLAIGVVVFSNVFGDDETDAGGTDKCVIGTWTVKNMTMDLSTQEFGVVRFTNVGNAGQLRLGANGTGYQEFGDGAEFTAETSGTAGTRTVRLKMTGTATFDFTTADSTLSFANVRNDGKLTFTTDAGATSTADLSVGSEPARYTCKSDTLTVYTEGYRKEGNRSGV